jgi:peptidoglycan/xylan/chitin deacetylase (PgdA/CDA1 family)
MRAGSSEKKPRGARRGAFAFTRLGARALLLAALISTLSCGATIHWQVRRLARGNPEVLYQVETKERAVALTIDDGPDPVTTPKILDLLKRNGARATFFIISERVPGNERLLERMIEEGHELGNHLTRDEPSVRLTPDQFERELRESHRVLSRFAPMRWFRPGAGRFNDGMLATLERHGYQCALGSVYPFDPQIPWSWFSRRFILDLARPGSIIILHDVGGRGERTLETLSRVLPELGRRGFRVVTLTELARLGDPSGGVESGAATPANLPRDSGG